MSEPNEEPIIGEIRKLIAQANSELRTSIISELKEEIRRCTSPEPPPTYSSPQPPPSYPSPQQQQCSSSQPPPIYTSPQPADSVPLIANRQTPKPNRHLLPLVNRIMAERQRPVTRRTTPERSNEYRFREFDRSTQCAIIFGGLLGIGTMLFLIGSFIYLIIEQPKSDRFIGRG